MSVEEDKKYMRRCLELAKLGAGRTAPNPMVGAVIVCEGKIIGEGYHRKCGEAHAEVNAISSVADKAKLEHSTIYVSLEPCSHFGKTPPCANLIIEKKIPEVVVGTVDPFAKVSGRGIEKLRQAGCKVTVGVLESECNELNRRFFTFHNKKRPYIILKWAESNDGFIDKERDLNQIKTPTWITGETARIAVHKQRSEEQAILIGTNTAENDNPSLTLRDWAGTQPLRIVIDRYGRLSDNLNLFDGSAPTLVVSHNSNLTYQENIDVLTVDDNDNVIDALLQELYCRNIQSVIVEGGAALLNSFIDRNLWDEAFRYIGQHNLYKGITSPHFKGTPSAIENIGNDKLMVYRQ